MANTYKGYELSMSLYPDGKILNIARASSGGVAFRESSLEKLKKSIDTYNNRKQKEKELVAKEKAKLVKAKKKKRNLFEPLDAHSSGSRQAFKSKEEIKAEESVTGSIEKNKTSTVQVEDIQEAEKTEKLIPPKITETSTSSTKKSFWDRLK